MCPKVVRKKEGRLPDDPARAAHDVAVLPHVQLRHPVAAPIDDLVAVRQLEEVAPGPVLRGRRSVEVYEARGHVVEGV